MHTVKHILLLKIKDMSMSEWMYLKEFSTVFILLMLCLCVYAFRYIEIYMHMFTHSPSPTHRNSKVTLKTKQNKRYIGKMLITSQANFCINCQSNELLLAAPLLMKDFQLFLETIFQCKKINSCRKQQKNICSIEMMSILFGKWCNQNDCWGAYSYRGYQVQFDGKRDGCNGRQWGQCK